MPRKMPLKKTSKKRTSASRPPIVAVLGHIDHGKTTLLDKIRQTNLAQRETGGITQHVRACQIKHRGQAITFIDTPGHAAFSQMRSRGAQVADLAILVVAADEGFKPQTKESLSHIQAAKIPYVVVINKIDLPYADVEKVKKELVKNDVPLEAAKGEVMAVPVSAKTGQGIEDLLEAILLLAETILPEGDPQEALEAVVIESQKDRSRGPVATIIVRRGSLKVGDKIKVEEISAKVRAMFDENKKSVKIIGPGSPGEILGFSQIPPIGGRVETTAVLTEIPSSTPKQSAKSEKDEKKLKLILKADVAGTLEAVIASLPENVAVISSGVGEITESDLFLAQATGAEIVGFRVKLPGRVKKQAEQETISVKIFSIIYDLLEEIEEKALKAMAPTIDEEVLGQAEIIAEFEIKDQRIAGSRVYEGVINQKDRLHLKRGEKIIGDCRLKSMKKGKQAATEAKKNEEFGAILSPSLDFKIGDVLVSFRKNKT